MAGTPTEFAIAMDVVEEGLLPYFREIKGNGKTPSKDEILAAVMGFVIGARYKKIVFVRIVEALHTVLDSLKASDKKSTPEYNLASKLLRSLQKHKFPEVVRNPNESKYLYY